MQALARNGRLSLLIGLLAVGCASGADELSEADMVEEGMLDSAGAVDTLAQRARDPNSTYIENLTARGTGCPAGSYQGTLSSDGLAFTLTFSKYFVELGDKDPGLSMSLNCNITLDLHTPPGTSYAITKFSYQGYAYVEEGALAKQTVQYAFQGVGGNLKQSIFAITGPYDQSYLFEDDLETRAVNLDFAPCGRTRTLQLRTTLGVERTRTSVSASANTSSIDGEHQTTGVIPRTESKLIIKFRQALCP